MRKQFGYFLIFISLFLLLCTPKEENTQKEAVREPAKKTESDGPSIHIKNTDHFNQVLEENSSKLIMVDLYADWCMPCRMLTPTLYEIAKEKKDELVFIKINVDENRSLASGFGVRGIPHISFIVNGSVVKTLTGLRSKEAYMQVIDELI